MPFFFFSNTFSYNRAIHVIVIRTDVGNTLELCTVINPATTVAAL